jgi:hypothetical protein
VLSVTGAVSDWAGTDGNWGSVAAISKKNAARAPFIARDLMADQILFGTNGTLAQAVPNSGCLPSWLP